MDVFKLKQGEPGLYELNTENFHRKTGKKEPYYQVRGGKTVHYAVCPECDNPIIVINLDVVNKVDSLGRSLSLFAKHATTDVPGIGPFSQVAYEECPLAKPDSFTGNKKTRKPGKTSNEILRILMEHADAVQYFINKETFINTSDKIIVEMFDKFQRGDGLTCSPDCSQSEVESSVV